MIHFFNPGHEIAILNTSPYYMAPANVVAMQHELAYLPAWYLNKEDKVFVWDLDDDAYFKYLSSNFGDLPEPILESELTLYDNEQISFWGISPQVIHYWSELQRNNLLDIKIPKWDKKYTYLNSRHAAKDLLLNISTENFQISSEIIPEFYTSLEDIEHLASNSTNRLLAKAPYSSSGRGLLWLPEGGLTRTERQILHGILKKQRSISIEKVLDKQIDFAMEFISDGNGNVKFEGYSSFETNKKGAYLCNYLGEQREIEKYLTEKVSKTILDEVKMDLEKTLSNECGFIYRGCIGVDMMIYKDANDFLLHPCLEINMRYNMGYLALKFSENYLLEGSKGYFYIDFSNKLGEIEKKHKEMFLEHSPIFEDSKLKQGYLPLCPVTSSSHYWAYVLISGEL